MKGTSGITTLMSLALGITTFFWTVAGQTSNPQLRPHELPAYLLNECLSESCAATYGSRWIGRTPRGELFLVARADCVGTGCPHWLVEKTSTAARALLELNGSFRLDRVTGRYPVVEVRARAEGAGILQVRYEWNGQQYTRVSTQRVYAVGGKECGTREQCRAAARRALDARQVDRALRIYKEVEGVSWI